MASATHGTTSEVRTRRNFTRAEYDKMIDVGILGEDEHVELVEGAIVAMSPEGAGHAASIDLCAEALRRAFGAAFTVRVQHPLVVDPDGEPEPDLAVVAGGPRAYTSEHPRVAALVVEVADSSLAYDRADKARLYARAGIPEYWIVNLVGRAVEVHRAPAPVGYESVTSIAPPGLIAPLGAPGAPISLADLLP